jgi:hypothetical protein
MPTWDMLIYIAGTISMVSFMAIAAGDTLVKVIDIIVKRTANKEDDFWAEKVNYWWECIKDVYETIRSGIDRVSLLSRPRKPQ